jgi:hypothetical protein
MFARHRTFLRIPFLACVLAAPAIAQSPALTSYPECTGKASASDSEAAHSAFLLGKRFFDEADYGSAIHNFVDAYKLDCTKTELLTIIARANELSGNKAEAVHALETYLTRAPSVAPEDKSQIQKRIDNLKAQIAAQAPPPTAASAPPPAATIALVPPPPNPTPPPPSPTAEGKPHTVAPWVVTISGGVILIAGGSVLLAGYSKYNTATGHCPNNVCQQGTDFAAEGNSGLTLEHVGVGLLVGGGVVTLGGLLWHFLEPTGPEVSPRAAAIRPDLGPGYVGVAGQF